jgi:hypothetical protein
VLCWVTTSSVYKVNTLIRLGWRRISDGVAVTMPSEARQHVGHCGGRPYRVDQRPTLARRQATALVQCRAPVDAGPTGRWLLFELSTPRANPLLGVLPDPTCAESVIIVDRGATLLLYTNGLIERRDANLDAGLDHRLTQAFG